MMEFQAWPKIPRLHRGVVITEKIDGTNACIAISPDGTEIAAQSRNRTLRVGESDNYGFRAWVEENYLDLMAVLGPGYHFGEWWGVGIGRGYGLRERRFSLFNTKRWSGVDLPDGVSTVPVVASGPMGDTTVDLALVQGHVGERRPGQGRGIVTDRKLVLAIDFDGVLHNPLDREPGYKMGKPVRGAKEAMYALALQGHTLICHTTRASDGLRDGNLASRARHVELWLEYFGFPRMQVTAVKPNADVYLDDRAVRFVNWNHALMAIEAERQ